MTEEEWENLQQIMLMTGMQFDEAPHNGAAAASSSSGGAAASSPPQEPPPEQEPGALPPPDSAKAEKKRRKKRRPSPEKASNPAPGQASAQPIPVVAAPAAFAGHIRAVTLPPMVGKPGLRLPAPPPHNIDTKAAKECVLCLDSSNTMETTSPL